MRTALAWTLLLLAGTVSAQTTNMYEDQGGREAMATATAALPTLSQLAAQLPQALGISREEAAAATLEPALRVAHVPLDRLKNYRSSDDPRSLLVDVETTFVPVAVGGATRTSIVLQRRDSRWVATDFGQADLAKQVTATRGTTAGAILVRVPALNLFFLARTSGSGLTLTPITDVPGTELRRGVVADAAAVLAALVPLAQAHNGEPT